MFPGMFFGNLILSFCVSVAFIFVALVVVLTPIILFIIETTRPLVWNAIAPLRIFVISFVTRYILKSWILDWLLVENGSPTRPLFFAPVWFMLIIINFVNGI